MMSETVPLRAKVPRMFTSKAGGRYYLTAIVLPSISNACCLVRACPWCYTCALSASFS